MTALYNAFHCYATSNAVVVVAEHFWPLFAPSFFIQLGFVRRRKKIKGYSAQKIGFSPPPFIIDHFIKSFTSGLCDKNSHARTLLTAPTGQKKLSKVMVKFPTFVHD